jgi:HlyD family secretion protein
MKLGWRGWGVIIVVAAAMVALPRIVFRPHPIAVEVGRAETGPVDDLVTNSEAGTVRTRAQARLGVERAGTVVEIPFREGARVRRGQVLLWLDASTARTRLEAARRDSQALDALHLVAHSSAALARQTLERTEQLRLQSVVSQEQMDQARSSFDAATAELRAAEARVRSAESAVRLAADEIQHLSVRAPFDGVVTRRLVEIGESVVPGQVVLELMSPDRLYVSAPIDERDAGRLATGLPARVTIDAFPDATWEARVTRVAPMVEEVEEQNRTVEVEVEVEGPERPDGPVLKPGMTADVEIVLRRREGVLRVPSAAVIEGRRVLVPVRGVASARAVEIGLKNWQWTEIRSGLAAGDRVVTSLDRAGLKAGVAVRVTTPEAAAADTLAAAARP